MNASIAIVERLIPVHLIHAAVWHGVADRDQADHAAVLDMLAAAAAEETEQLPSHRADSIKRHAKRAAEALLAPYIAEGTSCAKFGLTVFYAVRQLIDAGAYELVDGAFSEAMDAVLNPEGTVTEFANIDGVDASAQKQARKLIRAMQALGYFTDIEGLAA